MSYTPGPWVIGYGGQEGDDYAVITSPHRNRAICNLEPDDYDQANARLIAAALELLEALEAMVAASSERNAVLGKARAAIAKARGEA